jgi:hypothetical protein
MIEFPYWLEIEDDILNAFTKALAACALTMLRVEPNP